MVLKDWLSGVDRKHPLRPKWMNWVARTPPTLFIGFWLFAGYRTAYPYEYPVGLANGTYANPCCEKIVLADGRLLVGGELATRFVIHGSKPGLVISPAADVHLSANGLEINRYQNPYFIDLPDDWAWEKGERPQRIGITDGRGNYIDFRREGR